ncbi:MAG: TerD family protein [Frankia sp.]
MVAQFTRGQKSQLSALTTGTDLYVGIYLDAPGDWDISCFGLDGDGKLSDEEYFVFFNQPNSPEKSIQLLGAQAGDSESFRVTLDRVPDKIERLAFCAALDGPGSAAAIASGYFRLVAGGEEVLRYAFSGVDFTAERAVMIADLYRKGVWRVAAVGQGFAGGLAELIRSFGGDVADEAPAAPPAGSGGPPGFAPPPGAAPSTPAPGFGAPSGAPAPAGAQRAPVPTGSAGSAGLAGPTGPAPAQSGVAGVEPPPAVGQRVQPGAMVSLTKFRETPTVGRWTKQNSKMVKVTLGADALALRGSMVAYQGDVEFDYKGSGIRGFIENKLTQQGLKLMTCKGNGEVFLAEDASDLHIVELNGDSLCVNARNILAFDTTLHTEVKRIESAGIPGGGLFHLEVSGQGTIVVKTKGPPMTLPVNGPTFGDMNALVAWSVGMRISVSSQVRVSRQIYGGTSGEALAMQFMGIGGNHFIVVQPYEV